VAQPYDAAGHIDEALSLVIDPLRWIKLAGDRWFEAELYRLRAELLLRSAQRDQSEPETSFLKALEVAGAQSAKMWELRAATSLAHLWRSQGRYAEAYDLLAPVYGWFTEGFDTRDLKNARAVLDELR
jgi:predicted ATPase